ncbi:hypothetical protein CEXT_567881 [Caerostris extrusa]|uniref:Uncharacterized protein n=1 Tax=Caerostris extrusa TaxID=172846 RepID=A0AAV4U2R4_CAEEX|nr:hypothetical protein CEXT_567881 [Caerostris extrusa]
MRKSRWFSSEETSSSPLLIVWSTPLRGKREGLDSLWFVDMVVLFWEMGYRVDCEGVKGGVGMFEYWDENTGIRPREFKLDYAFVCEKKQIKKIVEY